MADAPPKRKLPKAPRRTRFDAGRQGIIRHFRRVPRDKPEQSFAIISIGDKHLSAAIRERWPVATRGEHPELHVRKVLRFWRLGLHPKI